MYSPYCSALKYFYLSASWACSVPSKWPFIIGWCFTKIKQFQERGSLRKLVTKKEKEWVIPNFDQFFALSHAAHLLDRLPSKGDTRRVLGPACLLNNLPRENGQIFKWHDPESKSLAVVSFVACLKAGGQRKKWWRDCVELQRIIWMATQILIDC